MVALFGLLLVILLYFCYHLVAVAKIETPSYKTIKRKNNIEIRNYQPMLIAEVTTTGTRSKAVNIGFGILANYIFGRNTSKHKIKMTAPVTQKSIDKKTWHIRFVMPKKYSLKTLPKPLSQTIRTYQQQAVKTVGIRFSGRINDSNLNRHLAKLKAYIRANKLSVEKQPEYAFYNSPLTPPFLRRNEIMFVITSNKKT